MKKNKTTAIKMQIFAIAMILIFMLASQPAKSQLIDVKPWTGTYPDMEGTYPLTFISFTGWLIPVPHVFVQAWPTHYYVEAVSMPVTDATEIAEETKTGLLRIVEKMVERSQMKGRYQETGEIKINTEISKENRAGIVRFPFRPIGRQLSTFQWIYKVVQQNRSIRHRTQHFRSKTDF